jgi:hypothetical protein
MAKIFGSESDEGGDNVKKIAVRKLETVKTTAAAYGCCCWA